MIVHFYSILFGERPICHAAMSLGDAVSLVPDRVDCRPCIELLAQYPRLTQSTLWREASGPDSSGPGAT